MKHLARAVDLPVVDRKGLVPRSSRKLLLLLPSTLFVTGFTKVGGEECLSLAHISIVVHRWLLLGLKAPP